ncbi:Polyadenylate-binding protein-interacting protein 11 [Camellia lanceoleosa]|uniref:Polyadenylate-binding protein-interacting protein 11 n=1 Tax=Camellia lanceoleosa TaxID=1840588 RepID=A0ACC0H6Q7_9ERIC|nr:Polyadenylate-binding protein-interacting protein 11 [Camellia lanceoleosa]
MAVVENAGSSNRTDSDVDQSKSNQTGTQNISSNPILRSNDQNFHMIVHQQQKITPAIAMNTSQVNGTGNHKAEMSLVQHGINGNGVQSHPMVANGVELRRNGDDDGEGFNREMRDLEEMLSKLNPMAEEFVPPSLATHIPQLGYTANFVMQTNGIANGNTARRKKNNYSNGKRRMNSRTSMAQREEVIRRTVYVSDIDHQVTEEQLAALFVNCGQVVDCRVCGDPNSVLRLPLLSSRMRSEDEREMCARTIYCTNIDKKVTQADVKLFFESICGEVQRLRLLGDYHHSTRIAFVEFVVADSAIAVLNCSGVVLGSLPIRVSPSKTPVRPRAPRALMH